MYWFGVVNLKNVSHFKVWPTHYYSDAEYDDIDWPYHIWLYTIWWQTIIIEEEQLINFKNNLIWDDKLRDMIFKEVFNTKCLVYSWQYKLWN